MPISSSVQKDLADIKSKTLKINEIFFSLQGETTYIGLPTVFIRLTGCPLRCNYCDTTYAFHNGQYISISEILHSISGFRTRYVTVTGGEPLAQKACDDLLTLLCDEGYVVSLETSGAIDIGQVDDRVCKILDIKTPASGEVDKNHFENIQHITKNDQIKFVICDRADYEWAKNKLSEFQLNEHCVVLFSPSYNELDVTQLAEWILEDQLAVRLQIQLHKYLWGDVPGK
jgi:7-carboxy-7-deazaguanine synthase